MDKKIAITPRKGQNLRLGLKSKNVPHPKLIIMTQSTFCFQRSQDQKRPISWALTGHYIMKLPKLWEYLKIMNWDWSQKMFPTQSLYTFHMVYPIFKCPKAKKGQFAEPLQETIWWKLRTYENFGFGTKKRYFQWTRV